MSEDLGIDRSGIAWRRDDGVVTIVRATRGGGPPELVEVPAVLAEAYGLSSGDVAEGPCELLQDEGTFHSIESDLPEPGERDETAAVRGESVPRWLAAHVAPLERKTSIAAVNGLAGDRAIARPRARKRTGHDRSAPDRQLVLGRGAQDSTGRTLDLIAPLGAGCAGLIYGPHGAGLSSTLRAVVRGVLANSPDTQVLTLLLRARGEEITEWRKLSGANVVVAPAPQQGALPEQALLVADLVLEAAARQTELGKDVLLAVDSLTGLWGALLETEHSDAQSEADRSVARRAIREWIQRAGAFRAEGFLGSGLGGSLTIVATAWHKEVDPDQEEDRELHPHLRLLEHILPEIDWRVELSSELAAIRLFPAVDLEGSRADREAGYTGEGRLAQLRAAREALRAGGSAVSRYDSLLAALDATSDEAQLIESLAGPEVSAASDWAAGGEGAPRPAAKRDLFDFVPADQDLRHAGGARKPL